MKWFARQAKEWGPRGVLVFALLAVVLAGSVYFATPVALDEAGINDGPGIPPELADHKERDGLERGMLFGAAPDAPLPRPDAYLKEQGVAYAYHQSPNWSGRNGCSIEAIVIHVTGPGTMEGMRSWFKNPTSEVSAHFGIGKNGEIEQYVSLESAAWHAGGINRPNMANPIIANWATRKLSDPFFSPNRCNVGIELLLAGPAEPLIEYPKMQASLGLLIRWLLGTLQIPADRTHIIGHYELDAVQRNTDPRCCVDLDSIVTPTATSSQPPECPQYPCLISGGLYRMADGWTWDISSGLWADKSGVVQFGPCNQDKLRWSPPIARWTVPGSAFFDPIRSSWAQAPAC